MKTKYPSVAVLLCACGIGNASFAEELSETATAPKQDANGRVIPPEMAALESSQTITADADQERGGWFVPRNSPLKNFYAGGSVGGVFTDYSDTVDDGSVFGVSKGDVGTAATVFLGYNFNDYFGVEASYTKLDNVDYTATSNGSGISWSPGPVSAEFEADTFVLTLVGRFPLTPRWTLIGKIGFLHWETVETFNESGFITVDKDHGDSAMVAGGFEYDLGLKHRIKLRGEVGYQRFNSENLDMMGTTLGFVYEFP